MEKIKIVLDGFGGDNAPKEIVLGAIDVVNTFDDVSVVIVGNEDVIKSILNEAGYKGDSIAIVNATDVISNNESPTMAIRQKKDSSLVVALDYINEHPEEPIAGFVSAGSTGAVLTGALLKLGRLNGIKRPALAPPLPNLKGGKTLLIDCGANMDSKPEFLCQFALMGSIYMKQMFGVENPRVALLNVGVEDKKGNELCHEAFVMLKEMKSINFVGNMEARDMMSGDYDVVVTDGFAGNVALKSTEGTGLFILKTLKREIKGGGLRAKIGYLFMKKALKGLMKELDYNSIGGSPFLGCKKVVIKSHGSSDRKSILGSMSLCREIYKAGFVETLEKELNSIQDKVGD
ncbi:MAG: phosphate acyltransferase PlsX [Clostridia bacterium]|nr:phosphate acyltransferase PlsX [Clostridia bacterium]